MTFVIGSLCCITLEKSWQRGRRKRRGGKFGAKLAQNPAEVYQTCRWTAELMQHYKQEMKSYIEATEQMCEDKSKKWLIKMYAQAAAQNVESHSDAHVSDCCGRAQDKLTSMTLGKLQLPL